jgi:hypothetical protein
MIGIIKRKCNSSYVQKDWLKNNQRKPVKKKTLLILYFLPRCGRETRVKIPEYLISTLYEVG